MSNATEALAVTLANETGLKPLQRLRFRVGEERLGGKARAIGMDFVLTVEVQQHTAEEHPEKDPEQDPVEPTGKTASDKR